MTRLFSALLRVATLATLAACVIVAGDLRGVGG